MFHTLYLFSISFAAWMLLANEAWAAPAMPQPSNTCARLEPDTSIDANGQYFTGSYSPDEGRFQDVTQPEPSTASEMLPDPYQPASDTHNIDSCTSSATPQIPFEMAFSRTPTVSSEESKRPTPSHMSNCYIQNVHFEAATAERCCRKCYSCASTQCQGRGECIYSSSNSSCCVTECVLIYILGSYKPLQNLSNSCSENFFAL